MPEVTETPTYSLWKGHNGGEFVRVTVLLPGVMSNNWLNDCCRMLMDNPDIYDLSWKHEDGRQFIVRRDGAQRGGEE